MTVTPTRPTRRPTAINSYALAPDPPSDDSYAYAPDSPSDAINSYALAPRPAVRCLGYAYAPDPPSDAINCYALAPDPPSDRQLRATRPTRRPTASTPTRSRPTRRPMTVTPTPDPPSDAINSYALAPDPPSDDSYAYAPDPPSNAINSYALAPDPPSDDSYAYAPDPPSDGIANPTAFDRMVPGGIVWLDKSNDDDNDFNNFPKGAPPVELVPVPAENPQAYLLKVEDPNKPLRDPKDPDGGRAEAAMITVARIETPNGGAPAVGLMRRAGGDFTVVIALPDGGTLTKTDATLNGKLDLYAFPAGADRCSASRDAADDRQPAADGRHHLSANNRDLRPCALDDARRDRAAAAARRNRAAAAARSGRAAATARHDRAAAATARDDRAAAATARDDRAAAATARDDRAAAATARHDRAAAATARHDRAAAAGSDLEPGARATSDGAAYPATPAWPGP